MSELRCPMEINWYEVGKETPRDGILIFLVSEKEPDLIYTGYSTGGQFRITGQLGGIVPLKETKFTHFAYVNNNMLPKNCKPGCLGSGWHLVKDELPPDDEPVAIWPPFQSQRFAVWNKECDCWDTEDGDDYMCDKDAVEKWYPINWGGVQ